MSRDSSVFVLAFNLQQIGSVSTPCIELPTSFTGPAASGSPSSKASPKASVGGAAWSDGALAGFSSVLENAHQDAAGESSSAIEGDDTSGTSDKKNPEQSQTGWSAAAFWLVALAAVPPPTDSIGVSFSVGGNPADGAAGNQLTDAATPAESDCPETLCPPQELSEQQLAAYTALVGTSASGSPSPGEIGAVPAAAIDQLQTEVPGREGRRSEPEAATGLSVEDDGTPSSLASGDTKAELVDAGLSLSGSIDRDEADGASHSQRTTRSQAVDVQNVVAVGDTQLSSQQVPTPTNEIPGDARGAGAGDAQLSTQWTSDSSSVFSDAGSKAPTQATDPDDLPDRQRDTAEAISVTPTTAGSPVPVVSEPRMESQPSITAQGGRSSLEQTADRHQSPPGQNPVIAQPASQKTDASDSFDSVAFGAKLTSASLSANPSSEQGRERAGQIRTLSATAVAGRELREGESSAAGVAAGGLDDGAGDGHQSGDDASDSPFRSETAKEWKSQNGTPQWDGPANQAKSGLGSYQPELAIEATKRIDNASSVSAPLSPDGQAKALNSGHSVRSDAGRAALSAPAPSPLEQDQPTRTGSARELKLQVQGANSERVQLQLRERNGEVLVSVRSQNDAVAGALRSDLDDLARRLTTEGIHAELRAPQTGRNERVSATENSGSSRDSGGERDASHARQNNSNPRKRDVYEIWEEIGQA
jgi:hypothetical protein